MSTQADFSQMLQKSQQLNLKHKTRIIELQNQLNNEKNKARQYQSRFKDAVLRSEFSEGQGLMEKLNSKEKELIDCRKQIIELNRRAANTNSSPSQTNLIALARENQELMGNIEQIKSAAISAIMMKEEQIQELNKTINKYDHMQTQLKFQYQKYESLQREFDIAMNEKQEEIKELTEKVSRERENFLNKLQFIQKDVHQEQHYKQSLLQKAHDLQGTIEKSQLIISEYENKIYQLQVQLSQQKVGSQQERARIDIEMEELRQQIQNHQREQKTLGKLVQQLKIKQRNAQQHINRLSETSEELKHKLTIKKKKQNKVLKDKITTSFAGVAKNNPVYASFAFRQKDSIMEEDENPNNLGDYPELQEIDGLIENFNLQDLGKKQPEEAPKEMPKEIPISQMMSKKKIAQIGEVAKPQTQHPNTAPNSHPNPIPNPQISKEIQNYKQSIMRIQTQKKELQITLNDAYNQMEQLNQSINNLTTQLQQERKNISDLRQQMKRTKKQSQLTVEVQSLTLHVEKLENDMIATKLKYAEQAQFLREKCNRQKVMWTQKLVQLTQKIAKQDLQMPPKVEEKKKKKGFFG